jgi:hypothetical protein
MAPEAMQRELMQEVNRYVYLVIFSPTVVERTSCSYPVVTRARDEMMASQDTLSGTIRQTAERILRGGELPELSRSNSRATYHFAISNSFTDKRFTGSTKLQSKRETHDKEYSNSPAHPLIESTINSRGSSPPPVPDDEDNDIDMAPEGGPVNGLNTNVIANNTPANVQNSHLPEDGAMEDAIPATISNKPVETPATPANSSDHSSREQTTREGSTITQPTAQSTSVTELDEPTGRASIDPETTRSPENIGVEIIDHSMDKESSLPNSHEVLSEPIDTSGIKIPDLPPAARPEDTVMDDPAHIQRDNGLNSVSAKSPLAGDTTVTEDFISIPKPESPGIPTSSFTH